MDDLTIPQLKVISALSTNLVLVWLVAMIGTRDPMVLLLNFLAAIVSVYFATKAEEAIFYD